MRRFRLKLAPIQLTVLIVIILIGLAVVGISVVSSSKQVVINGYRTAAESRSAMELYAAGKIDQAAATYSAIVKAHKNDFFAWNGLANSLIDLGEFDQAEVAYLRTWQINSKFEPVYRNLWSLYYNWRDESAKNDKIASFKKVIERGVSDNQDSVSVLDIAAEYYRYFKDDAQLAQVQSRLDFLLSKYPSKDAAI